MSFFEKIREKLFGESANRSSHRPLVSEPLLRTQPDKKGYLDWLQHGFGKGMQDDVYTSYLQKCRGEEGAYAVHLLQMPYANGFALTYTEDMNAKAFVYFFDWLKDRILAQGSYKLINADRQFYDKGAYVETKEKYYLKPHVSSEDVAPFNQYYGNILIEQIYIDSKPSYLKLVANIYSDRMYTKAIDFQSLMEEIFTI
jgi:hypothetical protein